MYFIYHSDFEKWSFGKLSALREANMALEEGYEYYYMGYYIHSCQKMRYKGDYQPQYFLDLDTFNWDRLDQEALVLMLRQKYVSMSRERAKTARKAVVESAVDSAGAVADGDTPMTNTGGESDEADGVDFLASFESVADVEAVGASVLEIGMPGVMTVEEVAQEIDLDEVNIKISPTITTKARVSFVWLDELDCGNGSLC